MSSAILAGAGAALLSVLFTYVPGLSSWYDQQTGQVKRLTMLGGVTAVAVCAFALTCSGIQLPWAMSCSQNGLIDLAGAWLAALAGNQSTYLISPKAGGKG